MPGNFKISTYFLNVNPILHFGGILLLASSCIKGPKLFDQEKADASSVAQLTTYTTEDGDVQSKLTAGSSITQQLSVTTGDLAGTSLRVPPGALSISVDVTISSGQNIASSAILDSLNVSTASSVQSASSSVAILASDVVNATNPFTLSIPLSSSSGLFLEDDDTSLYIVIFKVTDASQGGKTILGIIGRKEFDITDGKANIPIKRFGVYQVAKVDKAIEKGTEAASAEPILTKKQEANLNTISFSKITIIFGDDYGVRLETTATGATPTSCRFIVSSNKSKECFGVLARTETKLVYFDDRDKTGTSDEEDTKDCNETGTSGKKQFYTQAQCKFDDGRFAKSDWSDPIEDRNYDDHHNGSATVVAPITLNITFPTAARDTYVSDETAVRTVAISHNGDSVTCSSDGGSTYSACTSPNSFVWQAAAYNTTHSIKVTKEGAENSPYIQTFVPSSSLTGLTFVTCTQSVTGNESFSTFATRFTGVNEVICVDNNVIVDNDGAENSINVNDDGTTIIARAGHSATFRNSRTSGSQAVFTVASAVSGTSFVGLTIVNQAYRGIDVSFSDSGVIKYSSITVNSGINDSAAGIYVWSTDNSWSIKGVSVTSTGSCLSVGDSTVASVLGSTFTSTGGSNSHALILHNGGKITAIANSVITGVDTPIELESHSTDPWEFAGYNLTIHSNGTSGTPRAILAALSDGGGTFSLVNSRVFIKELTNSYGGGIYAVGGNGTITLEGNTFIRKNYGSVSSYLFYINDASTAILRSVHNNNRFCKETSGQSLTFSPIMQSDNQANFSVGSQVDGGAVNACPQ